MTDIAVNVTNNSTPINGLTDPPEITIRRLDTGAAVVTSSAMTDRTADGLYTFNFAETIGIPYGFLVDADPNATVQVTAQERYYNGAFSNDSQIIRDAAKLAPTAGAPAAGSIDEHLDDILTDTSIMEPIVSANLDVAVSTRNAVVPLPAAVDQAEHDATQAAIAALNDLSSADVQAALTAQGYTVARAANLDNLDVAVSTRSDHTPADVDTVLTAAHGAGSWQTGGGGSLTQQDIRDAMKLAPSPGAAAADSIDDKLDDLETQIGALNDLSIADVQTALDNQGYTAARAVNLDNLDVAVSTRNDVTPLAAAVDQAEHDATQAAIAALNDLSIADVQTALDNQGYTALRAANLDNLDVAVSTRNSVVPMDAVTSQAEHDNTQAGIAANLAAIAALNDLSIADVQTALDLQGYTSVRAANLDNLDVAVSTRSDHDENDVDTVLTAAHGAGSWQTGGGGPGLTQQDVRDAMKLAPSAGAPAADSIDDKLDGLETDIAALNDLSIADVQTALDNQGYTAARAPNLDNLDVAVSTRNSVVPLAAAADQAEHDATQAAIAALNDLSTADVQAALTAQGYTVARAGNLDNLDVAVSTRNSVVPLAAAADLAEHSTTQAGIAANLAAIGALNDLSQADVQAALTAQGYTVARAANLDNLDVTVSSRSDHDENDVDTVLTAAHGAGSWQTGGGGPSLTQQQVRDAMLLAPSPGAPALDSVDEKLDSIEVDTNSTDTLVQANLDATVSSRATPADIVGSEANVLAAIAALNDLSVADVQAALTAQGYTSARATLLDNLDAPISTRATVAAILAAVLGSGESVDVALSRLDNVDAAVTSTIPTLIAALNDLSIADVQTALDAQGYTTPRAANLDNLDASVASVGALVAALNDISVADILGATLSSGNTVDDELSAVLLLRDFIEGGREIDFTGSDALGWQRIERDTAGALIRRYNLFDETGSRINETVGSFIGRAGMISAEVAI